MGSFRLLDPEPTAPGAVIGLVTDVNDPDGLGRVEVELPWYGEGYREWARVAQSYAGDKVGSTWVPEVNGEVLVLFDHGNLRRPYVIGCLYNAVDTPPESRTASKDVRTLKTPSGSEIRVDETDQTLEIKTKSGASLLLEEKTGTLTIKATQNLVLDAANIDIKATGSVTVTGSSIALNP
jgi:phage baseplate assembly protein V